MSTPYTLTTRDYEILYSHTYASVPGEINHPFLITGFQDTENFRGNLLKKDGEGMYQWIEKVVDINDLDLNFPKIGYINSLSGMSFILHRKAEQQYRRTLYERVIQIVDPFKEERDYMGLPQIVSLRNKSVLLSIFNNFFFSIEDALDLVESGERLSAAISKDWCIACKLQTGITLLKDKSPVGSFVEKTLILPPSLIFLREEIEALGVEVKDEN